MEENLSISEIIDSIKEEETIIKKKKRGRPPKNKTEEKVKEKIPISNEDNEIIVHLKNIMDMYQIHNNNYNNIN